MAYIYSITNTINNKKYIGLTRKNNPFDRWKQHIKNSIDGKLSYPIYIAMRKYGNENFKFQILEECTKNEVEKREKYFIKKLKTYGDTGYNATIGGEGWNNKELKSISITSYTIFGEKIKDYDSITDAGVDLNIDNTSISRCIRGLQTTASGFRFSLQGKTPVEIKTKKGARNKTPIYGYNKNGEYSEWDSLYQFAKENSITPNSQKGIYNSIQSNAENKKQCRGWYLFEKCDNVIKWGEFKPSQRFRWTSEEYKIRVTEKQKNIVKF